MASTSAPPRSTAGGYNRMKSAASTLYNDNQSLIAVADSPQNLKPYYLIKRPHFELLFYFSRIAFNFSNFLRLFLQEMRRTLAMMKEIAVDLEKDKKFEMVILILKTLAFGFYFVFLIL